MDYYLRVGVWYLLVLGAYSRLYANLWAVHIKGGERVARSVAESSGFTFVETIMDDHYHFEHHGVVKRSIDENKYHHAKLEFHPEVLWVAQQEIKSRKKRDLVTFNDAEFRQQWYLQGKLPSGRKSSGLSMNVQGAWSKGYTGRGVVVTVLDDGIERTHPDLSRNYDAEASNDINGRDSDPMPRYDFTNENRHGTRCAGEVAAVGNNSICGVGVAFNAGIGGIRMLDGDVTDSVEAMALSHRRNHVDIYSASWGPDDDGKTVDGPATLARKAFRDGVARGRNGKGSIFVWASGNGGGYYDNCNCDGYTNSIYTLSVSSATEKGNVPWYSEDCSSTLVSTYSSGDHVERQITTTDLRHGCTNQHTGTSASAPLASGIVALVLQANPRLTWRDVQYISVLGATPDDLNANDWTFNGAGHKVSHHFGFGVMNAGKMVDLASNWTNIPEQNICEIASPQTDIMIQPNEKRTLRLNATGCVGTNKEVRFLEHVQAKITLASSRRGDLQIWLTSPSGTRSNLLTSRANDDSKMGFNEWGFLTTHSWGEASVGEWTLEISNGYRAVKEAKLSSWSLVLHGTATDPLKPKPTPAPTVAQTARTVKETYAQTGVILPSHPVFNTAVIPTASGSDSADVTKEENSDVINHIPTAHFTPMDYDRFDGWDDDDERTPSNTIDISSNTGIRCANKKYYLRGRCVDNCPTGYYTTKTKLVCESCHYTCAACEGERNHSCTECYFGSHLRDGRCLSAAESNIQVRTGASKHQGLSPEGLKSVVYGGISTVIILLAVLISLLVYYKHHQRKTAARHRVVVTQTKTVTPAKASYKPVNTTEILTGSQHSSQQELMESDESSSQGKTSTVSIQVEYKYNTHLPYGQPV